MTDFAPGDVVVCTQPIHSLRGGAIYRVEAVLPAVPGLTTCTGLRVDGATYPWVHDGQGWRASRFRKLPKADEQFTEQMRALRPSKVPATLSRSSENRNGASHG